MGKPMLIDVRVPRNTEVGDMGRCPTIDVLVARRDAAHARREPALHMPPMFTR